MNTIEIICTVIGAIITVIGGMWAVFGKVFKLGEASERIHDMSTRIDKMEEDLTTIKSRITGHQEDIVKIKAVLIDKYQKMEEDLTMIKSQITGHQEDIIKIKAVLIDKYPKSAGVFSMKQSPRVLNDWGEKLYAKIHGDEFIEQNKQPLFDYIKETKPLVALDVEQAANAACLSLTKTPAFNAIKDFVYNEPAWTLADGSKYEISLNDVCFVLGLVLRDRYLQEVGVK